MKKDDPHWAMKRGDIGPSIGVDDPVISYVEGEVAGTGYVWVGNDGYRKFCVGVLDRPQSLYYLARAIAKDFGYELTPRPRWRSAVAPKSAVPKVGRASTPRPSRAAARANA